jgi:hypothetical protein
MKNWLMNRAMLAAIAALAGLLLAPGTPAADDARVGSYPFVFTDIGESAGLSQPRRTRRFRPLARWWLSEPMRKYVPLLLTNPSW